MQDNLLSTRRNQDMKFIWGDRKRQRKKESLSQMKTPKKLIEII